MSEIKAASRALVEAQLRYDAPAVARLLAADFIYIGNDGSLADKTAFLPTAQDSSDFSNGSFCKFASTVTRRWLSI